MGFRNIWFGKSLMKKLDWFYLEEGVYQSLTPDEAGILCSRVFPGLWLNEPQLLQNNLAAVLNTLQLRLQSSEHEAFVRSGIGN